MFLYVMCLQDDLKYHDPSLMFWNLFVFCVCDSEIIEPEKNTSHKVIKNLNILCVLLSQENILKTY